MDIAYISIAVFSAVFLSIEAWKFLNWAWLTPKKLETKLKDQGLQGTPYKFLFGNFIEHRNMTNEAHSKPMNLYDDDIAPRVLPYFDKMVKTVGKNPYIWLGPNPTILLMEPELIKDVTLKNYQFLKVPHNPLGRMLFQGVLNLDRDEWAKHRKIVTTAFKLEKLKALTGDAISRTAFGRNYEQGGRIFELQREQAENYIKVISAPYIPGWRFLPTKMNRRMKEISRKVDDSIRSMINARMKAGKGCGDDLLGILFESNSKEIDQHGSKDSGMSIQAVIEECKLFYFAGQETTSALLVWTVILLSRHQEWQNRAREEVLQLFGTKKPDLHGLNHLKIVTMILHAVLRLYLPATAMIPRTSEETELGNLKLPEGVFLLFRTLLVHHDSELWGNDVKEFKPERFAGGVSNATKGQHSFFPFGWGPRICVGQNFAMLEVKMALTMILQRFSFQLSASYSHAPRTLITLQPQHGAQLILHKL